MPTLPWLRSSWAENNIPNSKLPADHRRQFFQPGPAGRTANALPPQYRIDRPLGGWLDHDGVVNYSLSLCSILLRPTCLSLWERCPSSQTGAERVLLDSGKNAGTPSQSKINRFLPALPVGEPRKLRCKQPDKHQFETQTGVLVELPTQGPVIPEPRM